MVIGVLWVFCEVGCVVLEDVSIVGFDGLLDVV